MELMEQFMHEAYKVSFMSCEARSKQLLINLFKSSQ